VATIAAVTAVVCVPRGGAAQPANPALAAPMNPAGNPAVNPPRVAPMNPAVNPAMVDALGSDDLSVVDRAVAAAARLPARESDPDVLFAAARACEDKLLDPGRAVAIYERLVADHPTARTAAPATRRIAALRELVGPGGETARQAAELAQLIARADTQPTARVIERGEQLAGAAWPGAPAAALWLADWLRRSRRFAEAQAHYATVAARWRRRGRWYLAAWFAIAGACGVLASSLVEAMLRSPPGTRWSALRPPIEAVFLGPVAAVLIGVAFTAHQLIAPAVATIALGGLALAWLSGAALERLRAGGRPRRLRGLAHVAICVVGVAGIAYVALTRDHLVDMLIETVRFGPEG